MKISFDYDNTLTRASVQWWAMAFLDAGADVYIVTSRRDNFHGAKIENRDVFDTASELGISWNNIIFTNYEPKAWFLRSMDIHFDDDELEIREIKESGCGCMGVLVESKAFPK